MLKYVFRKALAWNILTWHAHLQKENGILDCDVNVRRNGLHLKTKPQPLLKNFGILP